MDFKNKAFILVRAPARVIKTRTLTNKSEHAALLQEAQEKGYLLYWAEIEKRDGKFYAKQPWRLDESSVPKRVSIAPSRIKVDPEEPEPVEEKVESEPEGLTCPYCGEAMKSTSGRTLHVKSKHPEKYDEYKNSK